MEWRRINPSKNGIFEGKPQKDHREAQRVCRTQNDQSIITGTSLVLPFHQDGQERFQ